MGKIFYYYGTMKSSKTANLLMVYHNYTEKGINPILVKPSQDTRSGDTIVSSRVGIEEEATYSVGKEHPKEVAGYILATAMEQDRPILLDECQFFSPEFINALCLGNSIRVKRDTSENGVIMAYGLLTNFGGKLFEGAKAWLENADDIREVKTICDYCSKKATHNLLLVDGKPFFDTSGGDTIIGDTNYKVVCSEHWYKFKAGDIIYGNH